MAPNGTGTTSKSKQDSAVSATGGIDLADHINNLTIQTSGEDHASFGRRFGFDTATSTLDAAAEGVSPTAHTQLQGSAEAFEPSLPTPIGRLFKDSLPDDVSNMPVIVQSSNANATSTPRDIDKGKKPVANQAAVAQDMAAPSLFFGQFSTDPGYDVSLKGSHYVVIENVLTSEFDDQFKQLTDNYEYKKAITRQKITVPTVSSVGSSKQTMSIYLCLNDITECYSLRKAIAQISSSWNVTFITSSRFEDVEADCKHFTTSFGYFDGQANLIVLPDDFSSGFARCSPEDPAVANAAFQIAQTYGEVFAFQPVHDSLHAEFRVEFDKLNDSKNVIECLTSVQPASIGVYHIVSSRVTHAASMYVPNMPSTPHRGTATNEQHYCSPTGRSAWRVGSNGEVVPVAVSHPAFPSSGATGSGPQSYYVTPSREAGSTRWQSEPNIATTMHGMDPIDHDLGMQPRSASYSGNHTTDSEPQQVHVHKIKGGNDVRTTIMLRNLPNRWAVHNLKQVLDQTSFGQYDFSYLRIDFAYNTNVGYAFVNFVDPLCIVPFVEHWVGRPWIPGMGPNRKIAQVSYATVQGYDCLVEKFRNSAIMDEFPGFRPKLWYTDATAPDHSMVGHEQPFPPPNNMSKKQRSSDNAGQVGLYAPRSGQRGAERARRSHWDRGTPRQIQEDAAFYNQYAPHFAGHVVPQPIGPPPFFTHQQYGHYTSYAPVGYNDTFNGVSPTMHYFPRGGYQYGPAPYTPFGTAYTPVNPASGLRTMSNGRLAGRPRNVTVQPGNEDLAPGPARQNRDNTVPRSFGEGTSQVTFGGEGSLASTVRAHATNGMPYPQY